MDTTLSIGQWLVIFGPSALFCTFAIVGFATKPYLHYRKQKRITSIPKGRWYVSYRTHSYLGD